MKEYITYMLLPILSFAAACGVVWIINNTDVDNETCVECEVVNCEKTDKEG